jgi:CRP-like cAMP-binding protein
MNFSILGSLKIGSRIRRGGVVVFTEGERVQHIDVSPLALRLSRLGHLNERELAVVARVSGVKGRIDHRADVFVEGRIIDRPLTLVSGWAASYRTLSDGRRQIVDIHVPGDLIGFMLCRDPVASLSTMAVTDIVYGDASPLQEIAMGAPDPEVATLCELLRVVDLHDTARRADQAVRLGRLTAYERMAHLLLELHGRLSCAGLTEGGRFEMPLTQEMLADALGLSVVHVNRTLQQLRRDRIIELVRSRVRIKGIERLSTAVDYRLAKITRATRRRKAA